MVDPTKLNKYFFGIGSVLFGVSAVASAYSHYLNWYIYNFGSKISSVSTCLFNFVLCGFFFWMYKNAKKELKRAEDFEEELKKEVNKFKDGENIN